MVGCQKTLKIAVRIEGGRGSGCRSCGIGHQGCCTLLTGLLQARQLLLEVKLLVLSGQLLHLALQHIILVDFGVEHEGDLVDLQTKEGTG